MRTGESRLVGLSFDAANPWPDGKQACVCDGERLGIGPHDGYGRAFDTLARAAIYGDDAVVTVADAKHLLQRLNDSRSSACERTRPAASPR